MPLVNTVFRSTVRPFPRRQAAPTLLDYLVARFPYQTRAEWQHRVEAGLLAVNGGPASASVLLQAGDTVSFEVRDYPEPEVPLDFRLLRPASGTDGLDRAPAPEAVPDLFFVHKPAGLPVHRTGRIFHNTLARLVRRELGNDDLSPLNRLDQETSGIVAFARGAEAFRLFQPGAARWRKLYAAVAEGRPRLPQGAIDLPLSDAVAAGAAAGTGPTPRKPIAMRFSPEGKPCRTLYVTVSTVSREGRERSLLLLHPVTGRKHQIRAHLALLGHPLVGDKLYAHEGRFFAERFGRELNEADYAVLGARRHLLHAFALDIEAEAGRRRARAFDPAFDAEMAAFFPPAALTAFLAAHGGVDGVFDLLERADPVPVTDQGLPAPPERSRPSSSAPEGA